MIILVLIAMILVGLGFGCLDVVSQSWIYVRPYLTTNQSHVDLGRGSWGPSGRDGYGVRENSTMAWTVHDGVDGPRMVRKTGEIVYQMTTQRRHSLTAIREARILRAVPALKY
jgi:hypothetical protein